MVILGLAAPGLAYAQDCADDPAYASTLSCAGAFGLANCSLASVGAYTNNAVFCSWTGRTAPVDVKAVFCAATDPCNSSGVDELQVFGNDADGDDCCCQLAPNKWGGLTDWYLRLEGSNVNDTFTFDHNSYTLRAYDIVPGLPSQIVSIDAGSGDDTVALPNNNLDHECLVELGDGDDVLQGSPLRDEVRGGIGNDIIYGEGGDDLLDGEDDEDYIEGGDHDHVFCGGDDPGGANIDDIRGGPGDDVLWGQNAAGAGSASITCGTGTDEYGGGSAVDPANCTSMRLTAPAFCN